MKLDKSVIDYFKVIYDGCNTIEFTSDKKNKLFIPLFSGSIEHSIAIHVLDQEELTGSAFALARPMVESYLRAMWVKHCLDESKIEEGCKQLHFPKKLEVLVDDIANAVDGGDPFHSLKSTIEPIMANMHDFTHGGVQSIVRQYGCDGHLSCSHCREERDELLKLAILMSSSSFANLIPYMQCLDSLRDVQKRANELLQL
ncbi:DUF6988 family protein [Vibrio cholerae]|uniref:DUF6988 family protein n=2 Tax=Vibrio cholerae TaxID=666 RepID=UPI000F0B7EE4|nr:hypothetical protein [Vibrio cholerae]MCX9480035.1 hypothetical protein [Vibrio cholerae]RNE71941.1 hypothetical protein EEJ36_07260 [Vibrio cholerae]HAS3606557.1 hypothetical protein [Vibrio cholerae]HAS3609473.1 hypothetical protein [Vibrio cholerae]